jgi:hypothetical protein
LAVKFEVFLTAENEDADVSVQSLFQGARRASEAALEAGT